MTDKADVREADGICAECGLPINICNIACFAGMSSTVFDSLSKKQKGKLYEEYRSEIRDYAQSEVTKEVDKVLDSIVAELPEKGALSGKGYFGFNKRLNKSIGTRIVGAWDDAIDEVSDIIKSHREGK